MTRLPRAGISRRHLIATTAGAAAAGLMLPRRALAADPVKVAGVYTVPVEQQCPARRRALIDCHDEVLAHRDAPSCREIARAVSCTSATSFG